MDGRAGALRSQSPAKQSQRRTSMRSIRYLWWSSMRVRMGSWLQNPRAPELRKFWVVECLRKDVQVNIPAAADVADDNDVQEDVIISLCYTPKC